MGNCSICYKTPCWACIQEDEVGAIEDFGKFKYFAQPGYHCLVPCVRELHPKTADTRVNYLTIPCESITKDKVWLVLTVEIQYIVNKDEIYNHFYKLQHENKQVFFIVFFQLFFDIVGVTFWLS